MEELFFNYYRNNRGSSDLAPTFNNQKRLFEILVERKDDYLTRHGVMILTMRLLLAQEAFRKLQDYELRLKRQMGDYRIQSTETAVSGVVTRILYPQGFIGERIETETIRAHEYFYSFLTSIVSVLDRLANEINYFYKLNIDKVDWRNIKQGFDILEREDPKLKDYLEKNSKDSNKKTKLLLDYRDIAEHEGAARIEEFSGDSAVITHSYTIKVQSDPRNENSAINADLVTMCREFFHLVTKICDDAYGLIIKNLAKN